MIVYVCILSYLESGVYRYYSICVSSYLESGVYRVQLEITLNWAMYWEILLLLHWNWLSFHLSFHTHTHTTTLLQVRKRMVCMVVRMVQVAKNSPSPLYTGTQLVVTLAPLITTSVQRNLLQWWVMQCPIHHCNMPWRLERIVGIQSPGVSMASTEISTILLPAVMWHLCWPVKVSE